VVSAEKLAIGWIETRTPKELELYEMLAKTTHDIIKEAFSEKVIKPGKTTTDDVVWWLRQKVSNLGLQTWFHPDIDIQRAKTQLTATNQQTDLSIIQAGDLLHCDFGITFLRLNTDCQEHAYVLKPNETEIPAYLTRAFETGNALQDILNQNFIEGKSGNEILSKSLFEAKNKGLNPSIYSHPLGYYGHSAGPTIGMWDAQKGVPITGDYPLNYNTVYAIELNNTVHIAEWQTEIRIMLEQVAVFTEKGVHYIDGRQTKIHLIKS
ncbi:MAG: M24 family metallopeptidase, partial [Zetaproteobacteria bacterium]|nr:M24 family metallopeptidase [Flavobacteriales bacterium]